MDKKKCLEENQNGFRIKKRREENKRGKRNGVKKMLGRKSKCKEKGKEENAMKRRKRS